MRMCGAEGVNEEASASFGEWGCWSALLSLWIALVNRDKKAQVRCTTRGADGNLWRAT